MSSDFSAARMRTRPRRPESTLIREHARIANGDVLLIVRDMQDVQLPCVYNEDFGYMLVKLDNDLTLLASARLAVRQERAGWADVRTGNISLGVLPGRGGKASQHLAVPS